VHPGGDFAVGRGYLYSVQAANPTKEFVGHLNNGTLKYELISSGTDVNLKGFNLVGNPYPSSIDWAAASGWIRTSLKSTGGGYDMWIWNPTANNYGVYNSADADGTGTNSVTRYIAPMQGYFVQADITGDLEMNNGVRDLGGTGDWLKSTKELGGKVSIGVKSDAGYGSDEIQLKFGHDENENGAMKLFSKVLSAPSLYMASEGDYLSVLYLTNVEANPVVPLQFSPGSTGNFTINCDFDLSKFETVMLEDLQTQDIRNMKEEKTYNFYASKSDDKNRFILHFGPVDEVKDNKLPARIYYNGENLIIDLEKIPTETDVFVYDVLGHLLHQEKLIGETIHELTVAVNGQLLIVYLRNYEGTFCQKMMINDQ
jgi:hypothetical protein